MLDRDHQEHHELGQASLEHVAIVLVVVAVLTVVGVTGSGATIVNAVHSGIRRAICIAGGDTCAPFHVPRPCLIRRDEQSSASGASFLAFRVGGSESLVVERRSDGSVAVTAYRDVAGGVGLSIGVSFGLGRTVTDDERLVAAGMRRASKVEATAGLEARLRGGMGQTWEFPDAGAADAFLRAYGAWRRAIVPGHGNADVARRAVRAPDVERLRIGVDGAVTGEVSGPLGLDLHGSGFLGLQGEGTRDRRTGTTTLTLGLPAAVAADLSGPLNVQLGGGLRVDSSATVTLDRDLRPQELRLVGRIAPRGSTRQREVQLRVDLSRPEVGEQLQALLRGLRERHAGVALSAAAALGRWGAAEGWLDERVYRTVAEQRGHAGELALGLRLGFHDEDRRVRQQLLSARSRPPGGVWESPGSCRAPEASTA